MSPRASFELDHFEQVPATATTLLLRIAGRGRSKAPRLLVDDGDGERGLDPLPGPEPGRGEVRAAFSLPVQTLRRGASFALELGPGRRVELPAPRDRTDARADVHAELEAVERDLQAARRRSGRLDSHLKAVSVEVDELRAELERERGAGQERDALELALLAARHEVDELRRAQDEMLGRVIVLEAAVRAAERESDELRAQLTRRDGTFQR